jgi:hypothetical protein
VVPHLYIGAAFVFGVVGQEQAIVNAGPCVQGRIDAVFRRATSPALGVRGRPACPALVPLGFGYKTVHQEIGQRFIIGAIVVGPFRPANAGPAGSR